MEGVQRFAGWTLLLLAALIPGLSNGAFLPSAHALPACLFAVLLTALLLVIIPRLGSIYDWSGLLSTLIVFASSFVILCHVLNHHDEGIVAALYRTAQSLLQSVLESVLGETTASAVSSPLYLIAAVILLLSVAMRRYEGFVVVYGILLLYGMYPPKPSHFISYCMWFAGLSLVARPHLHLSPILHERLNLQARERNFLLALRNGPLTEAQALWHLCDSPDPRWVPKPVMNRLGILSAAGLIEYDPATRLLVSSPLLDESRFLPGTAAAIKLISNVSTVLIGICAGIYGLMPVDFLPEALLGPLGFVDDLVVFAIAAVPLGSRVTELVERVFTHRGKRTNNAPVPSVAQRE